MIATDPKTITRVQRSLQYATVEPLRPSPTGECSSRIYASRLQKLVATPIGEILRGIGAGSPSLMSLVGLLVACSCRSG
jgi:hypothetical protein